MAKKRPTKKTATKKPAAKKTARPAIDDGTRFAVYERIPKKHWEQLSGRHARVLIDQAKRYGVPLSGPWVDLGAVARWLHDFLAENGRKIRKAEPVDPAGETDDGLVGPMSPALERYREEKWKLARLDRMERERLLLPRDDVRAGLGVIASVIRDLAERLERDISTEARLMADESIDQIERRLVAMLGTDDRDDDEQSGADDQADP